MAPKPNLEIDQLRVRLKRAVKQATTADVAREAGVTERNLANFLSGAVAVPRGTTLHKLREWGGGATRCRA